MKKALVDFSETTGGHSLLLVKISATALLGCGIVSGAIVLGRAIQPLEKPTQRVASTAANMGAIGIAGLIVSGVLNLCVAPNSQNSNPCLSLKIVKNKRDERWEELVPELWGTECNISWCKGCKHLVGKVAPEKYMVCAMHPYGKIDCPDWEEK